MDELDHLLSSLEDHLGAATEKSGQPDLQTELEEAKATAAALTDETDSDAVEALLDSLEDIETDEIANPEVEEHIDAARRAAERARDW